MDYSFEPIPREYHFGRVFVIGGILILALIGVIYVCFIRAPKNFPKDAVITVKDGMSLRQISELFEAENVVRSAVALQSAGMIVGNDHGAIAGSYLFNEPLSVFKVAKRIMGGDTGIPVVKVTFPEGITVRDMSGILTEKMPDLDVGTFLRLGQAKEGYLFPDTYFFPENSTPSDILAALGKNFGAKTEPLEADVSASGHSLKEIIVMASLLEREAKGEEDIKKISGILWKRIDDGMRLQIDAPFYFLLGKVSKDLSSKDLALESAYNTYVHAGLPPGPIGNPGLVAIEAALHPEDSEYLFYLHDSEGAVHYAKTFAEHEKNITAFLK